MDLLDDLAEAAYRGSPAPTACCPSPGSPRQPDAVRRRVLRVAALVAGAPASELFHEHVLAMDALVTDWRGQRWVDLPGHLRGQRVDGGLQVVRADP